MILIFFIQNIKHYKVGVLNVQRCKTDYHMLFGERFIVPYSFIEYKVPMILPDNMNNESKKLIEEKRV